MSGLSIDFAGVVAGPDLPLDGRTVGSALLKALGDHYKAEHSASPLYEFEQSGARYLFDLASSADKQHAARGEPYAEQYAAR
jgi:hypothetical protein